MKQKQIVQISDHQRDRFSEWAIKKILASYGPSNEENTNKKGVKPCQTLDNAAVVGAH
jgi:hypothetical protein